MATVKDLGESPQIVDHRNALYADFLSQAVTGELIGMANYTVIASLCTHPGSQRDAFAHAASKLRHSERLRRAALRLGVVPIANMQAPHWQRVTTAFQRHAEARDLVACLVIQDVMLVPLAVSIYRAVADIASGDLAAVLRTIGDREEAHVEYTIEELRTKLAPDPDEFECKVERLHDEVMATLAAMVPANLRGGALSQYLRTLDRIGVRAERSLAWVARLAA